MHNRLFVYDMIFASFETYHFLIYLEIESMPN